MDIDTVEQYSVDEAFFTLKGNQVEVERQARQLKDSVERLVGIPVSVGVASSKTQAKYASSVAKKTGGVCVMDQDEWGVRCDAIKLGDLWGVGFRSADAYRKHGLTVVSDLLRLERRQVSELFGVAGVRLWQELQGIPTASLSRRVEQQKSILHSRSFKQTTSDISVLKDAVAYHVREAAEDLRGMHQMAACIQVSLSPSRHGDYLLQGGSMVANSEPTNDTFVLLRLADALVEQIFKPDVPYKKAGILLSHFSPETLIQPSMFADEQREKTDNLMPVIDAINKRSGKGSVLLGSRLQTPKWQSSKEAQSPAYTTNWTEIATVKA